MGELVGRFKHSRRPALGAIALTADTAFLTAWSNDIGYEDVFARQVEALGRESDLLLVISTSGQSTNLIRACEKARQMKLRSFALLGRDGGELARMTDRAIVVPSDDSQRYRRSTPYLHVISEALAKWADIESDAASPKPVKGTGSFRKPEIGPIGLIWPIGPIKPSFKGALL